MKLLKLSIILFLIMFKIKYLKIMKKISLNNGIFICRKYRNCQP